MVFILVILLRNFSQHRKDNRKREQKPIRGHRFRRLLFQLPLHLLLRCNGLSLQFCFLKRQFHNTVHTLNVGQRLVNLKLNLLNLCFLHYLKCSRVP